MRKVKKGLTVKVLRGKYKGQVGKVVEVKISKTDPKNKVYVYLEGIGLLKKSVKPNPALGIKGGFKEIHIPIHISNVMLYNPEVKQD